MRKVLLNVVPDYEFLEDQCPLTSSLASIQGESTSLTALKDEFIFPENEQGKTPFYTFSEHEITNLNIASEQVYNTLVDSLDFLFDDKYKHYIPKFFGKEFIENYPEFVEYAIHTFKKEHPAIYGRFDIAYDFDKNKIKGFYEGNLDTPTMYYDSVVMQHHLMTKLGREDQQFNIHQELLAKNIKKVMGNNIENRIAFVCDTNITEDSITTEMLYHAVNDNTDFVADFGRIDALNYDFTNAKSTVFTLNDVAVDYVFALYPWEDMVHDFYNLNQLNPLMEWNKWADNTKFLEPAWRWFVSNKGVWAWLTYLKEVLQHEDEKIKNYVDDNAESWDYIIPSYIEKPEHLKDYVMKPLQGRMSNNIMFFKDDVMIHDTDGMYDEDDFMYQKLCMTSSADDGSTSAIVCTWMAPHDKGGPMDMEAAGIAVREFTGKILKVSEERFVPHLMKPYDIV